jgi:hypothetical protein
VHVQRASRVTAQPLGANAVLLTAAPELTVDQSDTASCDLRLAIGTNRDHRGGVLDEEELDILRT